MARDTSVYPGERKLLEDSRLLDRSMIRRQLSMISRLHTLLTRQGIDHWLMGGWAVDFHAGRITRDHDDVDFAVWHNNLPRIRELLQGDGWHHSPKADEDGGTGYERNKVRLELTYLVRGEDGTVYTPLKEGRAAWYPDALGDDIRELGKARSYVVSLASIRRSKMSPRSDPEEGAKDRKDSRVLEELAGKS